MVGLAIAAATAVAIAAAAVLAATLDLACCPVLSTYRVLRIMITLSRERPVYPTFLGNPPEETRKLKFYIRPVET